MKRRLLLVAVFLLAGAVVNVAVAWGCILAFPPPMKYVPVLLPSDSESQAWWHDNRPDGVMDDLSGVAIRKRFGWRSIWYMGDQGGTTTILPSGAFRMTSPRPSDNTHGFQTFCGFPMMSLRGEQWSRIHIESESRSSMEELRRSGLTPAIGRREYPFLPIWPGFAVNTLFYAVVLWLLIPGPFALRRFIRVKRGLCPACAYPRGESDLCSECGKALA